MCGIAGELRFSSDTDNSNLTLLQSVATRLKHRGPDNQGIFRSEDFSCVHTRLSIIDTSNAANQPMEDAEKRFVLVFNGEIFNYRTLRSDLEKKGISFHTNSDTEVLLQLLIHDGKSSMTKINGFFAFAFYDRKEKYLLLARDRMGEKPMYYFSDDHHFCFASELNALSVFGFEKKINHDALYEYLMLTYIPAPETIYENVWKLEPGELLEVADGKITRSKYYQLQQTIFEGNKEAAAGLLYQTLHEAVERRLISDVPLCSFLSGGIDSTIISGIAKKYKNDLQTFSISFPEYPFYDETEFAVDAAKHIHTKHHIIPVSDKELNTAIDPVLAGMGEPFADSSAIPVYLLTEKVGEYARVALSGDGADELFGGYNKHQAFIRANKNSISNLLLKAVPVKFSGNESRDSKWSNKKRQIDRFAGGLQADFHARYLLWAAWTRPDQANELLLQSVPEERRKKISTKLTRWLKKDDLNSVLLNDLALVLPNDMLTKVDLMSMQHHLEVRPPFMDHQVAAVANSFPFEWKCRQGNGKAILKNTFAEFLPEKIARRNKKGFEVPLRKWMQTTLWERIEKEWFDPSFIKQQQLFRPEEIAALIQQLKNGKANEATIWTLIVFQAWWKRNMI